MGRGGSSATGTFGRAYHQVLVLVHMPTHKADVAASAFAGALNAIPAHLRKTLTYDKGKEMAARRLIDLLVAGSVSKLQLVSRSPPLRHGRFR